MSRPGILIPVLFLILMAGSAFALDDRWAPPELKAVDQDWVLLSSGEWLWGTIELMRDESLYFDSEKLDDLVIDWEDIKEIRSARVMTYVMVDGSLVTGTSLLHGKVLQVDAAEGLTEVPRARISSILEGEPNELNFWSVKIGADLKILSGNTTQEDFSGRVFLKREAARSRVDLRYQGNLSKVDHKETINNKRGNAEWKIFLSRKFFLTPVKAEIYSDKFKNIEHRNSVGVGVGYFISRSSKIDWYVELGTGYKKTYYESVQPGEDVSVSNATIPFRTTVETDLTSSIDLTAEYGVQFDIGNDSGTVHHTFILFEFDLFGDVDFNASMTWDHMSRPKENADGVTPRKDDLAVAYGLSINF